MRSARSSKIVSLVLATVTLALGGCGLVSVDMTSTPAIVKNGDPVNFSIKLTNQSPCPVGPTEAFLIPFISASDLDAAFIVEVPPDAPPEILQFIQELRAFFDQLCSGGQPTIPTPPVLGTAPLPDISTTCHHIDSAIECEFSGRVEESTNGLTFPLLGDRLHCTAEDGSVRCRFRINLPSTPAPAGMAKAAIQPLTCLTPEQLGIPPQEEFAAVCFLGTFPMFEGLAPGEMAAGQVTLPAHGAGVTRNLVVVMSTDAEDVGVCKGGTDAGKACDRSDSSPCTGSTCGEGICVNGTNPGNGCDVAAQLADCGAGGTCTLCTQTATADFLPIDCTTTYVSPEPAPVMSALALAGLAALLLATGTLWLTRRRGRG